MRDKNKGAAVRASSLILDRFKAKLEALAFPAGVEPTAFRLGGERSILLSYGNKSVTRLYYIGAAIATKTANG